MAALVLKGDRDEQIPEAQCSGSLANHWVPWSVNDQVSKNKITGKDTQQHQPVSQSHIHECSHMHTHVPNTHTQKKYDLNELPFGCFCESVSRSDLAKRGKFWPEGVWHHSVGCCPSECKWKKEMLLNDLAPSCDLPIFCYRVFLIIMASSRLNCEPK